MTETILIAEDEPMQRSMLETMLTKRGYNVIEAEDGKQALDCIKDSNIGDISAAILDISMPEMDGFDVLQWMHKFRPDIPVLILTSHDFTDVAVKAIKEGAVDFSVKPINPDHLEVALKNAIKITSLSKELSRLKRDKEGALGFADLIGHNAGLSEAVSYGQKAATSNVPALILGETGAGKELFARSIHGESRRIGSPFVAINCGAIPQQLVESTLFGHEKGAFTGASNKTIGKFREANGGTIFLDEIGELPLESQVKLLRVLQQKEVQPVGGSGPVRINVRIISATNRDLKTEVQEGRFREDLYFRLNVLPITVPPLRERKGDILTLAEHFVHRFGNSDMLDFKTFDASAERYLTDYDWPGNVRELENLIHRALVLCDDDTINAQQLQQIHTQPHSSTAASNEEALAAENTLVLFHENGAFKTMSEIEGEVIQRVVRHYEKNITRAADALGIAKSTFYRKLKEFES